MTTYTAIPNSDVDQDSPITQTLMTLLRDNPIAITEGATGAPRILDAAMGSTATTTGLIWIQERYALHSSGVLGTLGLFRYLGVGWITEGVNTAGSNLEWVSAEGTSNGTISPPGTWKTLGHAFGGGSLANPVTLFIRVA